MLSGSTFVAVYLLLTLEERATKKGGDDLLPPTSGWEADQNHIGNHNFHEAAPFMHAVSGPWGKKETQLHWHGDSLPMCHSP